MGELKGIIQFTGNFNGLSFYKGRNGKIIVTKKLCLEFQLLDIMIIKIFERKKF